VGRVLQIASRFLQAVCLLGTGTPLLAQGTASPEYRAKANFISNFPSFVDWPSTNPATPDGPFLICVTGDFSFGTSLAELTRGTTVHGSRVEIRWLRGERDLRTCQILFVSHSESKKYPKLMEALQGTAVLTIGETPDFLQAGGVVSFSVQQERLQFDVNLEAAKQAHLKISSRMLALARRVWSKTESAKS
jgi:YfiR/HmsC-like